ncbi:MAG: 16S rRNA (uracil(1498)-N(3))-methyltransferase [Gammaproteobacteria bacterium]|nr:16S rRNA (uracil(1498)-N(3))-methyltransferase [Gammaproteobacteria bacterium]
MRISRLYTDESLTEGSTVSLDKAASSYLFKVLRLSEGAELHLFNGKTVNGDYGYYSSKITSTGKTVEVTLEKFVSNNNHSPLQITLLQGISKGDHMDTTIQKAVELGVTEIIPIICERTVVNLKADRLDKKMRHWHGIAISACEQSGRNQLLTIHQPLKFNDLQLTDGDGFILQPDSSDSILDSKQTNTVTLLIGPEGGFSDNEMTLAVDKGFKTVRFGPRVLRTETAAIAAVSILQSLWGDLN